MPRYTCMVRRCSPWIALVVSACAPALRTRAPAAPCAEASAPSRVVTLPFAPEHAFAGWLDDHRAVIAELVEQPDRGAHVRAALIDAERGTVRSLGEPIQVARYSTGSPRAAFSIVDGRLVVIVYSTVGSEQLHAFGVDPETAVATEVAPDDAPPARLFLTSPLRAAAGAGRWAVWPTSDRGVDFAGGYVLDVAAARWHRVATALGHRLGGQVAALGGGRVALWGGRESDVEATTGVVLDLRTGATRRFRHPAVPSALVVARGSTLISALITEPGGLRGYVVDVDRDASVELTRAVDMSWRNHDNLVADGAQLGYLGADALHVRATSGGAWRTVELPFEPDAPSDVELSVLASGAWFVDGTDRGAFVFEPRQGAFCALAIPRALEVVTRSIVSPRYRLSIGGVANLRPGNCDPTSCLEERVEDPRAQIVELTRARRP